MKREEDSCQLILYSSNARTKAMEAISNAKTGNVVLANDNLKTQKMNYLLHRKSMQNYYVIWQMKKMLKQIY